MDDNVDKAKATDGRTGKVNPIRAIREKCVDCCCGSQTEVKLCPASGCPLWPFRLGSNPFRAKRVLNLEQRQKMLDRLSAARKARQEARGRNDNG